MGPDGMIEGNFSRIDVREPFPDMRLDLGDEYEHFVKISLDYNTCPNTNINNEVYIDGILVGRLTATNPNIISKIKNGDHIINLGANGQNITVNGGVSISLPCYGVSDKPLDQPFVCVNR